MPELSKSDLLNLFAAVHDEIATYEETQLLDRWLHNNPEGQRQYVDFIDAMQEIEHQVGTLRRDDMASSRLSSGSPTFVGRQVPSALSSRFTILALAASLLAMLGAGFWLANQMRDDSTAIANSDVPVQGIVTASFNGEAHFDGKALHPGSAVGTGVLKLTKGKMNVRLESGVRLSLAAPTEIDVQDSQQIELLSGSLTAEVPDEVIGFKVKTPGLNVVDLGTTFGVYLPENGQPKVHVFDGVVDAEVESNQKTVRLTDKQTILFDGTQVAETKFDKTLFVAPSDKQKLDPMMSGDVRFLQTPPRSVEIRQFEHDFILCFRERGSSITLAEDLPVSVDSPGHYHVYPRWKDSGSIPSGTTVDSYFVHLDAIGGKKRQRQGAITFDRPILGVVFSRKLLIEHNEIFGDPHTVYAPDRPQSSYSTTLENESVTLSADRRTIRFRWFIRALSDQVRILVASEDNSQ
jgi:ferric-dicitrate binding protein FerR (iron transport regulator)